MTACTGWRPSARASDVCRPTRGASRPGPGGGPAARRRATCSLGRAGPAAVRTADRPARRRHHELRRSVAPAASPGTTRRPTARQDRRHPCGVPHDDRPLGHIPGHDRTRADDGMGADPHAVDHDVAAEPDVVADRDACGTQRLAKDLPPPVREPVIEIDRARHAVTITEDWALEPTDGAPPSVVRCRSWATCSSVGAAPS